VLGDFLAHVAERLDFVIAEVDAFTGTPICSAGAYWLPCTAGAPGAAIGAGGGGGTDGRATAAEQGVAPRPVRIVRR